MVTLFLTLISSGILFLFSQDIVRRTPIHDAICNNMRDVVKAIPSPINLAVHSMKGYTPLHECVRIVDRFRYKSFFGFSTALYCFKFTAM